MRKSQKVIISTVLILLGIIVIAAVYGACFYEPKEEKMERKSREVVRELLASHEDGEVITRKTNPKEAAKEINEAFEKYYTDNFAEHVEKMVNETFESNSYLEKEPVRVTFFLVHDGEGFQFSNSNINIYTSFHASEGQLRIEVPPEDGEWLGQELGLPFLRVVKQGFNYKIDEIEK